MVGETTILTRRRRRRPPNRIECNYNRRLYYSISLVVVLFVRLLIEGIAPIIAAVTCFVVHEEAFPTRRTSTTRPAAPLLFGNKKATCYSRHHQHHNTNIQQRTTTTSAAAAAAAAASSITSGRHSRLVLQAAAADDDAIVVASRRQHHAAASNDSSSCEPDSRSSSSSSGSHDDEDTTRNDDKEQEEDHHQTLYYSPNAPLLEPRRDENDEDSISSSRSRTSKSISKNEYSFFDEAIIYVRAGSGGQGANSYSKQRSTAGGSKSQQQQQQGPPDGGNGGRGGSVILQVDASLNTLAGLSYTANRPNVFGGSGAAAKAAVVSSSSAASSFRHKSFRAEKGQDGASRFRAGRNGKDIVIRVPPGTIVQEIMIVQRQKDDGDDISEEVLLNMGTLTNQPPATGKKTSMIVAHGGQGGEGTGALVKQSGGAARGGGRRGTAEVARRQSAKGGERRLLKLTLQIVADVALVGVPNAGKSTFLAAVTRAKPKIASYAFTTVVPNLGVWIPNFDDENFESSSMAVGNVDNDIDDDLNNDDCDNVASGTAARGLVLCDVPGLIAGAADGVGLGHAFLRHVERCHVMVHLIDATSHDPIADYLMLNREIVRYNGTSTSSSTSSSLANMPQVVIVNKVDVFDKQNDDMTTRSVEEDWEVGLKVRWSREELQEKLQAVMPHSRLLWMSAKDRTGVDSVMTRLAAFVQKVKQAKQQELI
jgi:GTPase involved in cell partitioning and DNA repair